MMIYPDLSISLIALLLTLLPIASLLLFVPQVSAEDQNRSDSVLLRYNTITSASYMCANLEEVEQDSPQIIGGSLEVSPTSHTRRRLKGPRHRRNCAACSSQMGCSVLHRDTVAGNVDTALYLVGTEEQHSCP